MPIPAGTRLGPYEIVALLGAGGMGEVYRARDSRLQRDVAIKVLPSATAADPDSLARFRREALAVAALAHPNLLALYDVGSQGDIAFAVTELLEGATLRERLAGGALAREEVLEIARQLARGLAAAHEKGIVHRDLKPENIFLTRDGHVKILDFGLARRIDPAAGPGSSSAGTVTNLTRPGVIVGTLAYMAPEQLRGEPVDPRTDVFAFGAVAYEMCTGRRVFEAASDAALIAALLTQDPPPFRDSAEQASPALEAIVRRCLARDPGARYSGFGEVLEALDAAVAHPSATAGGPERRVPRMRMPGRVLAWAGVLAAILGLGFLLSRLLPGRRGPAGVPIRTRAIAMLEFENLTGDHTLDWVGRGLPELLGTALARSSELDVYDPQRLANLLAGSGHARDQSAPLFERLRARGVGRALVGSILRSGRDLRIESRVVDIASGRVLHSDASAGPTSGDIFDLAGGLIPKLQTWLEIDLAGADAGGRWLREITTSSSDAYRIFLRGHAAMMASHWRESAAYDEQSLALDSTFVAARFDLTGCYWNLGDAARTQASLAAAKRLRNRATPREALQLDMIEAVVRQDPEALIRTASSLRELYPENRFFTYLEGRGYFTAGRWERCVEVLDPLVKERWTWAWTYVLSARAYDKLGRLADARRTLETGMQVTHRTPELAFVQAQFLSAHGDSVAARGLLLEASRSPELAETPEVESEIRLDLGRSYEAAGRADSARVQYRRAAAVVPAGSEEARAARAALRRATHAR